MILLPPISTLFPYTTLFRSSNLSLEKPITSACTTALKRVAATCATSSAQKTWTTLVEEGEVNSVVHVRSEEHTSELQSLTKIVCRLLLEKTKTIDLRISRLS